MHAYLHATVVRMSRRLSLTCAAACLQSWHLSGDAYVEKGGKPWISEMYGYAFACARAGVWHTWDSTVMHYPTYGPKRESMHTPLRTHARRLCGTGHAGADK
eukprot:354861-Chlamydomonas_euryale.AAC.8